MATDTVTGLALTTNTRNWGISGTDTLPAGQSWTTGSSTDIQYAAGTRTRSNVSVSRTVDTDSYVDGDTHYYTTSAVATDRVTGLAITTNTRNWVTESVAYYYSDESVSISVTSTPSVTPPLALMKGNTAVTSLIESAEESDERLSSSITLTGSHATPAVHDITITDNTADADIDGTAPDPRASITFTVFVAGRDTTATDWGFTGVDADERYKVGGDDFTDDAITTAGTSHVKVDYSVIEGSGRLYVERTPTRKTSASRTITTSSAAVVRLDMNGSTNKVKAEISG